MFLSIKWKAILFFSLILFLVSMAWMAVSIQKGLLNLQQEINDKTSRQQLIFQEIITDEFQKLSQYAQLIVSAPAIINETPIASNNNIQQYIDENAFNWGLNLNMEYFILINENQQVIAEVGQLSEHQTQQLKAGLYKDLNLALQKSQKMVFCDSDCLQVVLEPVVFKNGKKGVVGYAQNMSELVTRYAYLSNTNIAILLASIKPSNNNLDTALNPNNVINKQQEKKINLLQEQSLWKPWAMSNYQTMLPVLEDFYHTGTNTNLSLSDVFSTVYFFNNLTIEGINQTGKPALYLNIFSGAKSIEAFKEGLLNTVTITLLVFVFSEIILILLLLGPLKKIKRLASIYEDLPNRDYQKAITLVSDSKSFFKDEFSAIEQHAMQLANELKEVDEEMALSQQELEQKVQVLSSAQDHLQQIFDQSTLYIATLNTDLTISSTNRNLQKIFNRQLQNSDWLSLIPDREEKQQLTNELKALLNKQQPEIQMLITMHTQDKEKALRIFWSYAVVADNNGENKVLAVGLPLSASTLLSNLQRGYDLNEAATNESAQVLKNDLTKSYQATLSSEHSELAMAVKNSVLKQDFKLSLQPRFAVKHLVIREYEAVISIENPACNSLDYLTIKKIIENESESESFLVDEWLIETVFKRIKDELEYHQNIGLIIPISSCALLDTRLLRLLQKVNNQYSLPFGCVNFEINELTDIKSETNAIQRKIKELHEMGHEASWQIDKVPELTIIRQFDVDNISLPMSLFDKKENLEKVKQFMLVAKDRGISITAKGVLSQEQYLLLQQLGVDKVQGDFIKEPQTSLLNSLDIVAIQANINNL